MRTDSATVHPRGTKKVEKNGLKKTRCLGPTLLATMDWSVAKERPSTLADCVKCNGQVHVVCVCVCVCVCVVVGQWEL